MDDFLPSPPPVADEESSTEHKLVPDDLGERQKTLEFGNGQL